MQLLNLTQQFIAKIKGLQNQFPERVMSYAPVCELQKKEVEEALNLDIPLELSEIFQFSNGLQWDGMELLGLSNPKLDDLLDENLAYRAFSGRTKEKLVIFMRDGQGGYFAYSQDEDASVYYIPDILDAQPEFWAVSLHSFFEMLSESLKLEYGGQRPLRA